ncbi:Pentatricopeptide repeat-containing protein [Raphanus sativus]|nr:Pentatricopeptide repeat-containing protein [Raphanus sativus]
MSGEITASLAAKASQALTTSTQLNQIHAQLFVSNSLHRQSYRASRLIASCTRRSLFVQWRSPMSSSSIRCLDTFRRWIWRMDALRLYEQRSRCGIMPDAFSFPGLIKSTGKFGVLFHALVEKLGLLMGPYVRNVIMGICM